MPRPDASLAATRSAVKNPKAAKPRSPIGSPRGPQRGIQSVEVGGQLLHALAHHGRPLPLKDLATLANMPPAKAHPYVVSFSKIGLMQQDLQGHYGLGPLAWQLGLMSLQQHDPLRLAKPVIEQLAQATGHTAAMAVWGNRGATIVRVAEPPALVRVTLQHGTVMSLTGTATGMLFSAWLGAERVGPTLEHHPAERAAWQDPAFQQELVLVRQRGLARAIDLAVKGTHAMAAPVIDASGGLVMSLTLIGLAPSFSAAWQGPEARELSQAARALSERLGGNLVHQSPRQNKTA